MPAQTTNLFVVQDLEDRGRTSKLADTDLQALRTTATWINEFVAIPNKDLGRAGPVCPFVPDALELKALWLAPEHIAHHSVPDLIQLINDYKRLLLSAQPKDAHDKAIVVVFTDVSPEQLKDFADDARIEQLKKRSYEEDGVVLGEFHQRNEGPAIHNARFHPFKPPIPFLLVRTAVISDWMFFLDNEDWLGRWARHFGESAVYALAEELRCTNWRLLEGTPLAAKA